MTAFGPYPARVAQVIDGDTIALDIDLGFDHLISGRDWNGSPRLSCRVDGINSPELKTPAGKAARDYASTMLPEGALCTVVSHGWDKYGGRFLGEITFPDGTSFGQLMIDTGHAKPYTGHGPKPV